MRRKIRCDSKLQGLPEVQRVKVDAWLFEDGRTYGEVVEGCLREFGLRVSKSSVGRYYERTSADRFAEKKRQERMALEPELSPAEAYEVLLRRIGEIALEEIDQPLEDINHKVVVRLVRVLITARREKHMATRVWVERRKAENWLAREVLRHWRREMRKKPHVSYLPMLVESPDMEPRGARSAGGKRDADCKSAVRRIENLRYDPAAGNAQQQGSDVGMITNGGHSVARPTIESDRREGTFVLPVSRETTSSGEFSLSYGGQMNNNQNHL